MVPLLLFTIVLHYSEKKRAELRLSRKAMHEPLLQKPPQRRLSRLLDPPPPGDLNVKKRVSLFDEFLACVSSLPFVSVVFSYAAYTAVLISVSTFGSAFLMALGFFDTETSAALVF